MKILLINHYAGSHRLGMEYRPFYLARCLKRMGHSMTIVGSSYSHVRAVQPKVERDLQSYDEDEVEYRWLRGIRYSGNGIKRFLSMLIFVAKLYWYARCLVESNKFDVIIASSTYPLDIFAAKHIARLSEAKLVFELHDLWPLSPMELGGMSKWHPFILLMQYAEDYACKKSDVVVSILPATKDYLVSRGMDPSVWRYIPNGISIDENIVECTLPDSIDSFLSQEKKKGRFLLAYTGAVGLANDLKTLILATQLVSSLNISVVIVGDGPERLALEKFVESLGISNVSFFGPVSKSEVKAILSFVDAAYIGLKHQPLFRFGISPNKLMDYMLAAKPVIQAINAGNDIVRDAQCGISVEPENPEEVASAMRKLALMSAEDRANLGRKGREYVLTNHRYESLAQKFVEALSD